MSNEDGRRRVMTDPTFLDDVLGRERSTDPRLIAVEVNHIFGSVTEQLTHAAAASLDAGISTLVEPNCYTVAVNPARSAGRFSGLLTFVTGEEDRRQIFVGDTIRSGFRRDDEGLILKSPVFAYLQSYDVTLEPDSHNPLHLRFGFSEENDHLVNSVTLGPIATAAAALIRPTTRTLNNFLDTHLVDPTKNRKKDDDFFDFDTGDYYESSSSFSLQFDLEGEKAPSLALTQTVVLQDSQAKRDLSLRFEYEHTDDPARRKFKHLFTGKHFFEYKRMPGWYEDAGILPTDMSVDTFLRLLTEARDLMPIENGIFLP